MAPANKTPDTNPKSGFTLTNDAREFCRDALSQLRDMSFDGVGISRETYGASETAAFDLMKETALSAGFDVRTDAACNLYMTLPGERDDAPVIATGSHMDSVPEGGNYDGAAGVVAGLAVLLSAKDRANRRHGLQVIALRGEESAWFGGPCYFGSRAIFGQLTSSDFATPHRNGDKTLVDCMRAAGADMGPLQACEQLIDPKDYACWMELHIEQGPVLVAREKPVGIVTGIRGNHRHRRVICKGEAAHSGAVPRWLRKDAVLAMADLMNRIDDHWRVLLEWGEDLVVTMGVVETNRNEHAISRVPGEVSFALEYRSQDAKTLKSFETLLQNECEQITTRRGVAFEIDPPSFTKPATMSPAIIDLMTSEAEMREVPYEIMPSGAGHDSSVFANAGIPSGMVFVRNEHGSHNPHEAMDMDDFFLGTEVLGGAMLMASRGETEISQ